MPLTLTSCHFMYKRPTIRVSVIRFSRAIRQNDSKWNDSISIHLAVNFKVLLVKIIWNENHAIDLNIMPFYVHKRPTHVPFSVTCQLVVI